MLSPNSSIFFDHCPDLLLILDSGGSILHANSSWESQLGWRRHEMIGQKLQRWIASDFQEQVSGAIENLKYNQPSCSVSISMIHLSGVRVSVQARLVKNAFDSQVYFSGFIAGNETQSVDRLTEDRYREVLRNLPVAVYIKNVNQDNKITFWNKAAETLWNLPEFEVVGKSDFSLFSKEQLPIFRKRDEIVMRHGVILIPQEKITLNDGRIRFIRTQKVQIDDGNLLGVSQDITELVQAHKDLDAAIDAINQVAIVATTDANGRIIDINENFIQISGYSREELLGQDHRIINSGYHEKSFFVDLWKTIRSGQVWRGEIQNRAKDGHCYWVYTVVFPNRNLAGQIEKFVSIRFDLTLQKKSEALLNQATKLSALGDMAKGIAHEINNPLTVIYGKANNLRCSLEKQNFESERAINVLMKIETTAERISKIVRGLQDFARSSPQDPFEKTFLGTILEKVMNLSQERLLNSQVVLKDAVDHNILVEVRTAQIVQMLLNLLWNAIDSAGMQSEKWVKIESSLIEGRLRISLTDSGPGISPLIAERMLEPFFTTKEVGQGSGLGLSVAKGIAESHSGCLFYQVENGYTVFVVEFPVKQKNPKASNQGAA